MICQTDMQAIKRVVVVVGEESGDIHAASFIESLKKQYSNLDISGIGGPHMEKAGATLVGSRTYFGVTGLTEVLSHFREIKRAFKAIKTHLSKQKPDLLVLVDCPGFNLRLAKFAKQVLGIRVLYYISPQIWAWKANRIHMIRKNIDRMAVIFPFEKALYEKVGVPVSFVGHPLAANIKDHYDADSLREELGIPRDKPVFAMLPGSRRHEIERHMPVLVESAKNASKNNNRLHFVIPLASSISPELVESYLKNSKLSYTLLQGRSVEAAACSDYIVVASGTASLECALLAKPMCIIYKTSFLAYLIAAKVMRVKYLGLCNLLQNKMLVPELLQYDCNSEELTKVMLDLMSHSNEAEKMTSRLLSLKYALSSQQADCSMSELIALELGI